MGISVPTSPGSHGTTSQRVPLNLLLQNCSGQRGITSEEDAAETTALPPAQWGISVQLSAARFGLGCAAVPPLSGARAAPGTAATIHNPLGSHKASQHINIGGAGGSLSLQPLPRGERPALLACNAAAHLHFFQHFEEFCRLKKKRRKSPVQLKETRGEPAQATWR